MNEQRHESQTPSDRRAETRDNTICYPCFAVGFFAGMALLATIIAIIVSRLF